MNYIRHLSAFYMKAAGDNRLTASHISLYHALFQFWNMNRFKKPVFVNRPVLMKYSKIGSNHTLYGCLNELHQWGYIEYMPSFSPKKGTYVNLCIFDTGETENAATYADFAPGLCKNDIAASAESAQVQCKNDIGTCAKMHSYINNSNINYINSIRERDAQAQNPKIEISDVEKNNEPNQAENEMAKRKKVAPKKEKGFVPPSVNEALAFFKSEQYPELEARKFFFHFESNGWKVGGKSPMENWQAAAHNWMLNVPKYDTVQKPNAVKLNTSKDYGEPL